MPPGRVAVSCSAPFGAGGLGRHLQELVEALRRGGRETACVCEAGGSEDAGVPCTEVRASAQWSAGAKLARFFPAWRMWLVSAGFDSEAARRLPAAEHLIAFNGTAVAQLAAAGKAGFASRRLVSATPHMRRVLRQDAIAHERHPLERPWATRLLGRNLREYAAVEEIYVSSRYSLESFLDEGFSEDRVALFPLTPEARFKPAPAAPAGDTFDVVYAGALTVNKGVPLLIEAVRRLGYADLRLVLVGGWKSRGMRRFIQAACAADPRISVRWGDPLTRLQAARLYVHPSYYDGFAYAPAEALACGVPVLASEDTGMKDLIGSEREGLVLPTGELDALTEAIAAAYRGEIFTREPAPLERAGGTR
jgi:glycosyltransferase involved in cell wall biosynthesis